ncbi:hypothetical protein E0198_004367 [Clavispora lusitaniae]|nr:hypothetical protein E0198_004367 [Clavispora lusitaniae]
MSYTVEKKVTDAEFPRGVGATHLPNDRLKIVYHKYKASQAISAPVRINMVFAHGTGMNKSVWKTHIEKLYELSEQAKDWKLDCVLALDCANHGDSACLNRKFLGWSFDWRDGAKDLIKVVKNEINTTGDFVPSAYNRNIVVGHSLGGFQAAFAGYLESTLFDSVITVEPVLYFNPQYTEIFQHRIKKITSILRDKFSSREDAVTWFKKKSFYKIMDKRVLDSYVDDEVALENGNIVSKSSTAAQLATYMTAITDVGFGQDALKHMRIPFLHVIGTEAMWNPPDAVEFIRESVPPHLLETADLEGDHLVHGTNVDGTVNLISGFIERRAKFVRENRSKFPEVKYGNDREAIFKSQWKLMMDNDLEKANFYASPAKRDAKL